MVQPTVCGISDTYRFFQVWWGTKGKFLEMEQAGKLEGKIHLGKFLMIMLLDVQAGNEKNQVILSPESGR